MKKPITIVNKSKSGSEEGRGGDSPSRLIDARIKGLGDWRGEAKRKDTRYLDERFK